MHRKIWDVKDCYVKCNQLENPESTTGSFKNDRRYFYLVHWLRVWTIWQEIDAILIMD